MGADEIETTEPADQVEDEQNTLDMTEDDVARLRAAVMRLSRDLRKTAVQEGLTTTQSSVLATVVRQGEIALSDLAENEGLNPTMLSRVIGFLEENRLVERQKDTIDKRAFVVLPTSLGRRLVQRLRNRRTEQLKERVDLLDDNELLAVLNALPALEVLAGIDEPQV